MSLSGEELSLTANQHPNMNYHPVITPKLEENQMLIVTLHSNLLYKQHTQHTVNLSNMREESWHGKSKHFRFLWKVFRLTCGYLTSNCECSSL